MENITFNLSELHCHGTAYFDYLALRKQYFVDTLGWDIPHNDTYEMDQYDNPLAHYSLVLKDGKVIGGARGMPTTSSWGDYTYMIRDAASGKLSDIPNGVIEDIIETPKVWECTRLVVSDELVTHNERYECLDLIVDGLAKTAREYDAGKLIALMRPSFLRALRQLGYEASIMGKPYFSKEDGRKYAVLGMSVNPAIRLATVTEPKSVHVPLVEQPVELRQSA